GFVHAPAREGSSAGGRDVVAGHAADALECFIAGQLLGGQGAVVTLEPQVEAGVGGDQRLFKLGDGIGDVLDGDFRAAIDFQEVFAVLRNGVDHVHCQGVVGGHLQRVGNRTAGLDRKSTRLNSSHVKISYAVFCLKKKK